MKYTYIVDLNRYAYQSDTGTFGAVIQLLEDFSKVLYKASTKFIQQVLPFQKTFDRLQPNLRVCQQMRDMASYGD